MIVTAITTSALIEYTCRVFSFFLHMIASPLDATGNSSSGVARHSWLLLAVVEECSNLSFVASGAVELAAARGGVRPPGNEAAISPSTEPPSATNL